MSAFTGGATTITDCMLALLLLLLAPHMQVSRSIVEGVERLDRQLRGQESIDTITSGIKQLQDQLQQLVNQAQPLQ